MKKFLAFLFILTVVTGCASSSEPYDETRGWSVSKLYAEAKEELDSGNYSRAIKLYETLESRFPYGRYAQQAQMDLAYTHYRDQEPELALAAIDRFIKLHPVHPNLDYMYYLKGLIYFNNDTSIFSKWGGQDLSERDPKASREAFLAFKELVDRYPESIYSTDSTEKMETLLIALGGYEMHVARYYMKRGNYLAAVNRAKTVLTEYSNTPYQEEALAIMVAGYEKLGEQKLSQDTQRVLALNYPNSQYLNEYWRVTEMPWWRFWK